MLTVSMQVYIIVHTLGVTRMISMFPAVQHLSRPVCIEDARVHSLSIQVCAAAGY